MCFVVAIDPLLMRDPNEFVHEMTSPSFWCYGTSNLLQTCMCKFESLFGHTPLQETISTQTICVLCQLQLVAVRIVQRLFHHNVTLSHEIFGHSIGYPKVISDLIHPIHELWNWPLKHCLPPFFSAPCDVLSPFNHCTTEGTEYRSIFLPVQHEFVCPTKSQNMFCEPDSVHLWVTFHESLHPISPHFWEIICTDPSRLSQVLTSYLITSQVVNLLPQTPCDLLPPNSNSKPFKGELILYEPIGTQGAVEFCICKPVNQVVHDFRWGAVWEALFL